MLGDSAKITQVINAAAARSLQSCPTLCDSIDGSPPGSTVPGKNTGVCNAGRFFTTAPPEKPPGVTAVGLIAN